MKLDRYLELSRQLEDMERSTEEKKRASYTTGNEDVLHNFKRDGQISGIGAMQNLLQHLLKQVAAIVSYVKHPDVEPSESLASRAGDVRTYMKLLVALAEDEGRVTGLEKSGEEATPQEDKPTAYCGATTRKEWTGTSFCTLKHGHVGKHEAWGGGQLYDTWW